MTDTTETEGQSRYVLSTLLDAVGFPYEFMPGDRGAQRGTVWLHYGTPPSGAPLPRVVIPSDDHALWKNAEPACTMIDNVPVLFTHRRPPHLLSESSSRVHINFDLPEAAFWLLSRQEELRPGDRDRFDRYPFERHWLVRHALADVPVLNRYAALLRQAVEVAARKASLPLIRKARWPLGHTHAIVLSHDVDDAGRFTLYQAARLLRRGLAQKAPRGLARGFYFAARRLGHGLGHDVDPYWNFDKLMRLEDDHSFRSTFFFTAEAGSVRRDPPYEVGAAHMRELLARLAGAGWEIGLHGSFQSYRSATRLERERQKLFEITGSTISGVRQHYLRLSIPETFHAQAQAGFVYDSTVGYRGGIGFRSGAAFPFYLFDPRTDEVLPLLELPLTVMDGALFWALDLTLDDAVSRTVKLLDMIEREEGLAVLLWHQRAWHERKYPGWGLAYETVLEHLERTPGAWVATGAQVAEWWFARDGVRLRSVHYGDGEMRWHYRSSRPVRGLVMDLLCPDSQAVRVEGAEARVTATGDASSQVELPALNASQAFAIVISEGE